MENTGKTLMHTQLALVLTIIHQSVCAGYVGSPLFIEGTVVSRNIYLVDREASRHQGPEIRLGSLVCTCSLIRKKNTMLILQKLSVTVFLFLLILFSHTSTNTLFFHTHTTPLPETHSFLPFHSLRHESMTFLG